MILNNLKLTNFRKFRDELIEFPRGIMGIIGKNGSGKSTILEAIGWVLYGNVVARSGKEDIKSQNATEDDVCKVELEFSFGDHNYKIIRELRGKTVLSQAAIFIDGAEKPTVARDTDVSKYVENILRMDYSTFMRSVYAKQKELGSLSEVAKGERQKAIRKMLNIEVIDTAVDNIRSDARNKEAYAKGLKFKLEDADILKEKREVANKEIDKKKTSMESIEDRKDKLKKEKDVLYEAREKQESLYKKYNELQSSIAKLSSRLEEYKKRLEELEEEKKRLEGERKKLVSMEPKEAAYEKTKKQKEAMEELRSKYERKVVLEKEVAELNNEIEGRAKRIEGIKKKLLTIGDIEAEQKEIKEEAVKLKKRKDSISGRREKVLEELSAQKAKLKELTEHKKSIRTLGPDSECPTCLRKLGNSLNETLKHLDEEMEVIRIKSEGLEKIKDGIDKENEEAEKIEEHLEKKKDDNDEKATLKARLNAELKGEQGEHDKAVSKHEKNKSELAALSGVRYDEDEYKKVKTLFIALSKERDEIISLRKDVSRLPGISEEVVLKEKDIEKLSDELKAKNASVKILGFDDRKYAESKKAYEQAVEKFNECAEKFKDEEAKLKVKRAELKALDEKIEEQKKHAAEIKNAEEEIQYLKRLSTIMVEFRDELINRIRPLLIARASYLFKELTEDRYPLIDLDEDYNIYVVDDGKKYGLKRFSGGEEDLANLCLRIAISQVIAERSGAEINFLALDEIFGSQDETRRSNILNAFNKLVNQFTQIILITHIITIREKLPAVLRIEEDSNKESHAEFD